MGIATDADRNIVTALNEEWSLLHSDARTADRVRSWSAADPRLRGATSLRDIETCAAGPMTPDTDVFFRALLDLASAQGADGDLAARVLLQLMIGRVIHTSRSMASLINDIEERTQLATVALYEAIRTCPSDKMRYLPPHLAWTTHRRAMQLAAKGANEIPMHRAGMEDAPCEEHQQMHPSEELAQLLAWSVAEGVLSTGDADLLAHRYGEESPGRSAWSSLADADSVASSTGLSITAMRQRCSRAARKLASVSGQYLAQQIG